MAPIQIFEDPWAKSSKSHDLGHIAVLHLQVSNFFLKLLPHFPSGDDGRITDEALVYSEWRYLVYIRFLQRVGLSPHEVPPPWDVAMIWYCHLMSTIRFHNHLNDSGHTAYGLFFTQFPIIELASLIHNGKWSHKKAQTEWDTFIKKDGYDLTYQLWSHLPWEESPGGLTRLFRKSATSTSSRLSKVFDSGAETKDINVVFGSLTKKCHPQGPQIKRLGRGSAMSVWSLKEYTDRRSRPWPSCDQTIKHDDLKEKCNLVELTPWPTIQDTKAAVYRQTAFWSAISKAQTSQPDFIINISKADQDYAYFMSLFRHRTLRASQFDPHVEADNKNVRAVPPTLEVDLLWHTHRLHPGSYWPYCQSFCMRLIDAVPSPSVDYFQTLHKSTRERWQKWLPYAAFPVTQNSTMEWTGVYTPEAAVAVGPEEIKQSLKVACLGFRAERGGKYRTRKGKRNRYGDVSGGGGAGAYGPGDWADAGGGGCGGDGGGGGGGGGGE